MLGTIINHKEGFVTKNNRINANEIINSIRSDYNRDNDILFVLEKYQFYLALVFKFTHNIFHNNNKLYKKSCEILKTPENYYHTLIENENKKRKDHYTFFNKFLYEKMSRSKMNALYERYNYILRDLFGFYPENSLSIYPYLSSEIMKKVNFFHFIFF